MESPPAYNPPQKSNSTVIWWIVGGIAACCIVGVVAIGGLGFYGFSKIKGFAGCMFSFKDAQAAVLKYAHDHGGKLPNAATWQDDVREDYRQVMTPKSQLGPFEQMSADGDWGCKGPDGVWSGMAFNSDLSGKKLDDVRDQVTTIMIFETEHPSKNLNEPYKPRDFKSSPKIVAGAPRGWMSAPVSGPPTLSDQQGRQVPVNTGPSRSGVTIQTDSK